MAETDNKVITSPCIRNCCLDDDDVCLGCFRNLDEITGWSATSNAVRQIILKNALGRRKAYHKHYKQP